MGKIRIAKEEDAPQILEIYQYYITNTVVSFEVEVPPVEEMKKRIRNSLANFCWLVWEEGGKIEGYAYASKHHERAAYRWAVDVSIYIRENRHGKGVGKALYSALFSILKEQGYYTAYACICLPNSGSVGIHEHFGFKKNGQFNEVGYKYGKWWDIGWWELSLKDKVTIPSEPIPIKELNQEILQKILLA